MKLLNKIKGWFYREKHYPGGVVYKRILFFSRICDAKPQTALTSLDKEGKKAPTWEGNEVTLRASDRWKIDLIIKGKNNKVYIGKLGGFGAKKLKVHIYGNDNTVTIGDNVRGRDLFIRVGEPYELPSPTHHACLSIGDNCNFVGTWIHLLHSHSNIEIGKNCLFSFGIQIRHTDGHPIYEKGSRVPINLVTDLVIGDHVWVGHSVSITKNARIAHDCVVGASSVVCKKYDEPYCAIAGNPAKVIRRNIEWEARQTKEFTDNLAL